MSGNLEKRVKKLESGSRKKSGKSHGSIFIKMGKRGRSLENYISEPPDIEKCKKYGQRNIEAIKKQRIAKKKGYEILKWVIEVVG